jgi:hypothetical protein
MTNSGNQEDEANEKGANSLVAIKINMASLSAIRFSEIPSVPPLQNIILPIPIPLGIC